MKSEASAQGKGKAILIQDLINGKDCGGMSCEIYSVDAKMRIVETVEPGTGVRTAIKNGRKCAVCGTSPASLCKRCRVLAYCSLECQLQDWKSHKAHCIKSKKRGASGGAKPGKMGMGLQGIFRDPPSSPEEFVAAHEAMFGKDSCDDQRCFDWHEKAKQQNQEIWQALFSRHLCVRHSEASLKPERIDMYLAAAAVFHKHGYVYREGGSLANASLEMEELGDHTRAESYKERGERLMMKAVMGNR